MTELPIKAGARQEIAGLLSDHRRMRRSLIRWIVGVGIVVGLVELALIEGFGV